MRKVLAAILAMTMALSMSTTVFAGNVTSQKPGDAPSIDVKAKHIDNTSEDTVYSVDINWEEMIFTYHESGAKIWNPSTHTYTDETIAGWGEKTTANITVTNHSNAAVKVDLVYEPVAGTGVNGVLDITSDTLETGEGKTSTEADALTSKLTISGTPNNQVTADGIKVGSIKITLSAVTD